jgi:beta-lactamase class D
MQGGASSIFCLGLVCIFFPGTLFAQTAAEEDLSAHFGAYSGAFALFDSRENRWLRYHAQQCQIRSTPCSTFKVLNSLIALETGIADGPNFALRWDGIKRPIEAWNRDQTLRSAFAVSCLWYYENLAARIGLERYKRILAEVRYGNGDVTGGLPHFWLESSLMISPDEQVDFLHRLYARKLPFSAKTVDTVLDIMTLSRDGGTTLRGKTGTAGDPMKDIATLGWFIGSVSTESGDCFFATRITGGENPSGRTARKITESILASLKVFPAR